jgi:hypothetical protein
VATADAEGITGHPCTENAVGESAFALNGDADIGDKAAATNSAAWNLKVRRNFIA